ncbi:hypothetical protein Ab1vBOLIVR4_gp58 [Agrobacterium phage OLIVR4]|nr:hypothetical protein Ab1vBOLIVR4_gp58 [Agrobacterium phage OLIVR4]
MSNAPKTCKVFRSTPVLPARTKEPRNTGP